MFPETWVIDPQGTIRARFDGARDWANGIVLDLVNSLSRPAACDVEFRAGEPSGPGAETCSETAPAG
jgi:hypothetical protein